MQDRAIVEIGKIAFEQAKDMQPYELYVEDISPINLGHVCKMFVLTFEFDANQHLHYKRITSRDVNHENYRTYAYRKGSARGGDITFTTKYSGDVDKKLNTLLSAQLPKVVKVAARFKSETPFFQSLSDAFTQKLDAIKQELNEAYEGLDKKKRMYCALSVGLMQGGKLKLLGEFETIQHIILESGTQGKKEKYKVQSSATNKVCSICHKQKEEVLGFASPFMYATADKPGVVPGFFKQANNWKNYPICSSCSLEFELGKREVVTKLIKPFYGGRFYLIPKTTLPNQPKLLKIAVDLLSKIDYAESKQSKSNLNREERLLRRVGKFDNSFTLSMLFYEENPTTKAQKIKLMLEEIPPSRFKKLFIETAGEVNKNPLYDHAVKAKKEVSSLEFSMALVKQFFPDQFYEMVDKIFKGQVLPLELFYVAVMHEYRKNYNKQLMGQAYENPFTLILKAHLLYTYLSKLNIIQPQIQIQMQHTLVDPELEEKTKKSFDMQKMLVFMNENQEFFKSDVIKGVFALGVMVKLIMNIQQYNLGSTPFQNKLKGHNLTAKNMIRLFNEGEEKVNQYLGIYAYQELREFIAEYMNLNKHKLEQLSSDEATFYMVTGVELAKKFKTTETK